MMVSDMNRPDDAGRLSLVLYCLIGRKAAGEKPMQFLLVEKQGQLTFPPTKFRRTEDLYHALVRPMEEDLGLPEGSYFPEEELKPIPSSGKSLRYPGLPKSWYLYPVVISLTAEGRARLESPPIKTAWLDLAGILSRTMEPNVRAIAEHLRGADAERLAAIGLRPSMDALASRWAASQEAGFRVVRSDQLRQILDAGSRAFNLRVADPYLPYQRQGFGFTWSFFTPKDKQDVHVHGLPAVEIYGVLEGRLQIWHKPMNQRGVRTWQCRTLHPADWAEVEPLSRHFACWLGPQGLGTVIKAAAGGELAGVGKLGVSGKTTCKDCNACSQCVMPPTLLDLIAQYGRPDAERDYEKIERLAVEAERELSPATR
jgi:mannose-6-phosphate isomerase-like protein (cupin superfamily)